MDLTNRCGTLMNEGHLHLTMEQHALPAHLTALGLLQKPKLEGTYIPEQPLNNITDRYYHQPPLAMDPLKYRFANHPNVSSPVTHPPSELPSMMPRHAEKSSFSPFTPDHVHNIHPHMAPFHPSLTSTIRPENQGLVSQARLSHEVGMHLSLLSTHNSEDDRGVRNLMTLPSVPHSALSSHSLQIPRTMEMYGMLNSNQSINSHSVLSPVISSEHCLSISLEPRELTNLISSEIHIDTRSLDHQELNRSPPNNTLTLAVPSTTPPPCVQTSKENLIPETLPSDELNCHISVDDSPTISQKDTFAQQENDSEINISLNSYTNEQDNDSPNPEATLSSSFQSPSEVKIAEENDHSSILDVVSPPNLNDISENDKSNAEGEEQDDDDDEEIPIIRLNRVVFCPVCRKGYGSNAALQQHIVVHGPHNCQVCGKSFPRACNLRVHMAVHAERTFFCEECKKSYKSLNALQTHKSTVHLPSSETGTIICDTCGIILKNRKSLQQHEQMHTLGKRFACQVCHERFHRKDALNRHVVRIHVEERFFVCQVCEHQFNTNDALQDHLWVHESERPHECSCCKRRFPQRSALERHMRSHTGDRPFTCGICGTAFTRSYRLKHHMQRHGTTKKQKVS